MAAIRRYDETPGLATAGTDQRCSVFDDWWTTVESAIALDEGDLLVEDTVAITTGPSMAASTSRISLLPKFST